MKHLLTWISSVSCILLISAQVALAQSPVDQLPGWVGPSVAQIEPTSASIRFGVEPAVSGAVVYGRNGDYRSRAEISPLPDGAYEADLDDLTPNSTYHYRLELKDEAGAVYVSADGTFVTPDSSRPPISTERPHEENLASLAASARIVAVSSNLNDGDNSSDFGAHKAIDGLSDTSWASNGDASDGWIEIELAKNCDVSTIGFWSRQDQDGSGRVFRFLVSTDRGESFGPFELPSADRIFYFPVELTARQLRFQLVETAEGNTGAVAIEVFGQLKG